MGGNSKNLTVIFILSLVKLCPSHLTSPHHCQQKTAAPDVSLKRSILINAAITAAFSVPLESWMRNGPGCMAAWQWRTWAAEAAILHSASRAPSRGPRHWRRIRSVAATIDALLRAHWNKYAQRAHRLYRLSVSIYIDEKTIKTKYPRNFYEQINKERELLTRIRLQGSFLWTNHRDSFNTNCFNCHQLSTSKLAFNHQKKDKWWYTYVQYRWWFPSFFPGFQVPRTLHLSWGCNNYVTNMVTRA